MRKEDVKAFRKSRGFSVSKMAKEIGIARQTLSSIEKGNSKLSDIVRNYVLREESRGKAVVEIKQKIMSIRSKMEEIDSLLDTIIQTLEGREE